MAGVRFDDVTKRFDGVLAVDEFSLDVADGEFMVLLGPSGCGKSTALRMVAGLEEVTAGSIWIGDRVVNRVDPAQRDVSMVFQSYALYPHMSVARNIDSPLRIRRYQVAEGEAPRKLTKPERRERVEQAAEVLGLSGLMDRKPAALSGGQRQRVALARAFVGRPQAFLMDEPLSNLDAKLRAQTRTELVELHSRVETTVIYVTHDQVEAMTMASRIAVMAEGQLQQVGTPQEVYEAPANLFVAHFIGTPPMNTLEAKVTTEGGTPRLRVAESSFAVPAQLGERVEEGQPVTVGVRPEHLVPDPEGPIELDVRSVEWLGHEGLISGRVGDQPLVVRQAGIRNGQAGQGDGARMRLSAPPEDIHLFDPETTVRLT